MQARKRDRKVCNTLAWIVYNIHHIYQILEITSISNLRLILSQFLSHILYCSCTTRISRVSAFLYPVASISRVKETLTLKRIHISHTLKKLSCYSQELPSPPRVQKPSESYIKALYRNVKFKGFRKYHQSQQRLHKQVTPKKVC